MHSFSICQNDIKACDSCRTVLFVIQRSENLNVLLRRLFNVKMANILISDAEKTFILHGVEDDLRCDGRSRCDYRPMEIETGLVTHANGSCRLRLANTDVLVAVKSEIDIPQLENPDEGKITFFVDCSANAAPEFEGRAGEDLAMEFSNTLETAYRSRQAFNLKELCILPQQRCWKLNVDVLVGITPNYFPCR